MATLSAQAATAATTTYLRPNGDTTTGWTTTGATHAWEALDDNINEQEAPSNTDYISGYRPFLQPAPVSELALTSTSLSGQTILSATAWFYTPSAGSVVASVKSGSTVLGSQIFTTAGWHAMALALNGTQSQLDNATLVLSTESGETQYVYAAFLRLVTQPETLGAPTYLRPNGDTTTGWTTTGAAHAWEALDDNVTEKETPSNADYISGRKTLLQPTVQTKLELGSTSMSRQTILSAAVWFYTPTSGSVTATVNPGLLLEIQSETFTTAGWHVMPVSLNGTHASLDNTTLSLSTSSNETQYVYAAFLRLVLRPAPSQIYWGAWMSGEAFTPPTGTAPWDEETWSNFEKDAGKAVSIVHFGQPPPWSQSFDPTPLSKTRTGGSIPLMDMSNEPDIIEGKEHINVTLEDIANGNPKVIGLFEEWASEVAEYKYPFFFRWDWEMNGTWFQWGEEAAENPELFVKAWHRLHDIAQNAGATNITWVWCPNTSFGGSTALKALYPGDTYVDWLCIDGYNRGTNPIHPEGWTTFHERFSQTYLELLSIAPWKPIMVGETASTEIGNPGDSKATWISEALKTEIPTNFPNIRALVWFNWYFEEKETKQRWDWPIESSASAKTAFASATSSPYYASDSFGALPALERIQPLP